ncbi:hypothetical protein [Blautia massiliensis (ex Durand et al. 2017)]|uniref:hypothetical protein n=1 Tax=Blautia massiliensis (ex Durand et al. 2017) TaxID=1737424 RepID=UPI00241ED229|nr:hypothetical protein [Blautia massiliensis (ex Durand et al. 2017)]MBN2956392.1 hypothetical protein [Blautia massiliensis (ex Durand et al. 2017)]
MKKKQLFAVLLAGSMTVGMAPAAAFAAEDTGAVTEAEAPTADENTETPDDGAAVDDQSQSEADAQAAAQAQAEAEAQAAAQAQAEAEAQAAAQAQAEAEAQAAAQAQAEEAQQEQTETVTGTTVTDEAGLAAAIAAASDIDINNVNKDNLTTIVISGTVQITAPVTIPANKGVLIVGKDDTSMIQRADGFTGNLFDVSGVLYMLDNSDSTLVVDGGSVNGVPAAGSLIHVASGAKFSMSTGITLTNNKVVADATTADTTAAAIFNEGGIVHISGGTIENNSSDKGAVYSTGKVFIEKIENTAETEPVITNNTKADGTTPANIILAGEGQLAVNSAITNPQIGFYVENAEERLQNSSAVIVKGDDCSDSDYLQALSVLAGKYEDVNYKVNPENGQLVSNKPTVNIDIPTSEEANTVSVTFTSDKAGTYYYKYVAKGAEAPTIEKAIEGGTVKAGETTSLKLTNVTDKTIDLYIWVKESESGNNIVGEGVKKEIAVTQAQNPDNPKPAAPKVTKISAKRKTATTAEVVLQSDKSGTCYYKWVAKGADKPSISTTKDSNIEITENKDFKIDLKNLKGDAIDLYVQVVAKDGSESAVTKIATVTLKETAKTPAKISNVSYKWKSHTSATVTMRSDKAGVYYYKWVNRGSKAPTVDKMSKGKNVSANKDFTISLKDLDANNAIDVYVSIKGTDGTVSTPKKIALDEAKRPANVRWVGFSWINHTSANVTLISNKSGTCYYKWVSRNSDGTSATPKDLTSTGKQTTFIADKKFNISLEDLDSDNPIDLYIQIKDKNGVLTNPLKIAFKEDSRPKVADPTPTNTPNAYIPDVKESIVQGLDEAIQFYPNQFYEFTVIGAGTTNQDPNEGDVKWVPVYWSTAANPTQSQMHTAWKIGSAKGINKDATYNLYVFFQKYIYTGGQWQQTDTIESAVYQFKSAKLTPTGTPGADGSYGGGQTGSNPDATITGEASATSSNGGNGTRSKNAVSTADNSPVGTMSALAVASLLAGGYVIVRRRKKDI